jgi:hypothetical protein
MNDEELKHIQTICRDWLMQPGISSETRLTILPGGPLRQVVEVELRTFITPDDTTIASAVDVATGVNYAGVVKQPGKSQVFLEMPVEKIPKPANERLLPPGNPPPTEWHRGQFGGKEETEPDPVNDEFPLISVGDRVFVRDGWDLEDRGYGVVKDILTTTYPYPTYLVEIDGKISHETRYDLILQLEDTGEESD